MESLHPTDRPPGAHVLFSKDNVTLSSGHLDGAEKRAERVFSFLEIHRGRVGCLEIPSAAVDDDHILRIEGAL